MARTLPLQLSRRQEHRHLRKLRLRQSAYQCRASTWRQLVQLLQPQRGLDRCQPHPNSQRRRIHLPGRLEIDSGQFPSMKSGIFMDGSTKTKLPSMKKAKNMDGKFKNIFPSMKTGFFMDGNFIRETAPTIFLRLASRDA